VRAVLCFGRTTINFFMHISNLGDRRAVNQADIK